MNIKTKFIIGIVASLVAIGFMIYIMIEPDFLTGRKQEEVNPAIVEAKFDMLTAKHSTTPVPYYTSKTTKPSYSAKDLDLELVDQHHSNGYYELTYKITNNSSYHTFSYVEAKVKLLDDNGDVLTSDWTYAVGSEGIDAGDSNEFTIMIKEPSDDKVDKFNCSIIDYM